MNRQLFAVVGAVAAIVLSSQAVRADDNIDELLPADTRQFVVLQIKPLVDSELYKKNVTDEIKKQILDALPVEFLTAAQIDPLKDVERIVLATSVISGVQDVNGTIVLCGNFDAKKIEAAAIEQAKKDKNSVTILRDGTQVVYKVGSIQSTDVHVAVVDARRIIVGVKLDDVKAALERAANKKSTVVKDKEILKALSAVDAKVPLFARFDKGQLRVLPGADDPNTAKLFDKVNFGTIEVRVEADLKFALTLVMNDADSSKELKPKVAELADQLKAMVGLIATAFPDGKPLADAVKKLEVTTKGRTITMQLTVPADVLEAIFKLAKQ
jgi:hypothetical protein